MNRVIYSVDLSAKLARTCGIFFKVRHLLPTNVLVFLYYYLFASFLQIGIAVWEQINNVNMILHAMTNTFLFSFLILKFQYIQIS